MTVIEAILSMRKEYNAFEVLKKVGVFYGKPVNLLEKIKSAESSPPREKILLAEAWCIYGVYRGFTSVEKTLIDWSESESAARANLDTRLKYNLNKDQYQELVLEKKKAVKNEDGTYTFS